ncbi:hypothetical protein MHYP_G00049500 [Metynnis hypsauchen]
MEKDLTDGRFDQSEGRGPQPWRGEVGVSSDLGCRLWWLHSKATAVGFVSNPGTNNGETAAQIRQSSVVSRLSGTVQSAGTAGMTRRAENLGIARC